MEREDAKLRVVSKLKELASVVHTQEKKQSKEEPSQGEQGTEMGTKLKKEKAEPSEMALKYLMGDALEVSDEEDGETAQEEVDRYMACMEDKRLDTLA